MADNVFALMNQKGGPGKTTLCGNLGWGCYYAGEKKILLVDGDPQGDLTSYCFGEDLEGDKNLFEFLLGEASLEEVLSEWKDAENGPIDVITSNVSLAVAYEMLRTDRDDKNGLAMREEIKRVSDNYDIVIIDSPPSTSYATLNILNAADYVVLVFECDQSSLRGAEQFLLTLRFLQPEYEPKMLGMIANKYSENKEGPEKMLMEAKNSGFRILGDKVWRSASFEYLHNSHKSIFTYGYSSETKKYRLDTQKWAVDAIEEIAQDMIDAVRR